MIVLSSPVYTSYRKSNEESNEGFGTQVVWSTVQEAHHHSLFKQGICAQQLGISERPTSSTFYTEVRSISEGRFSHPTAPRLGWTVSKSWLTVSGRVTMSQEHRCPILCRGKRSLHQPTGERFCREGTEKCSKVHVWNSYRLDPTANAKRSASLGASAVRTSPSRSAVTRATVQRATSCTVTSMSSISHSLLALPPELHFSIFFALEPHDLLRLKAVCSTIRDLVSERHIWEFSLRKMCYENYIFEATYDIAAMSVLELQRASMAAWTWHTRLKNLEKGSRILQCRPVCILEACAQGSASMDDIVDAVVVPGGRYVIGRGPNRRASSFVALWDVGSAPGGSMTELRPPRMLGSIQCPPQSTNEVSQVALDGKCFRFAVLSRIGNGGSGVVKVCEVGPLPENSQIRFLAQLDFRGATRDGGPETPRYNWTFHSEKSLVVFHLSKRLAIWNYCKGLFRLCSFNLGGGDELFHHFPVGNSMVLFIKPGIYTWNIPPLLPVQRRHAVSMDPSSADYTPDLALWPCLSLGGPPFEEQRTQVLVAPGRSPWSSLAIVVMMTMVPRNGNYPPGWYFKPYILDLGHGDAAGPSLKPMSTFQRELSSSFRPSLDLALKPDARISWCERSLGEIRFSYKRLDHEDESASTIFTIANLGTEVRPRHVPTLGRVAYPCKNTCHMFMNHARKRAILSVCFFNPKDPLSTLVPRILPGPSLAPISPSRGTERGSHASDPLHHVDTIHSDVTRNLGANLEKILSIFKVALVFSLHRRCFQVFKEFLLLAQPRHCARQFSREFKFQRQPLGERYPKRRFYYKMASTNPLTTYQSSFNLPSLPTVPETDPSACILDGFRIAIAKLLSESLGLPIEQAYTGVDYGKKGEDFTVALPRFRLPGKVDELAKKVTEKFTPDEYIESVVHDKAFLHFRLNTPNMIRAVLTQVHDLSHVVPAQQAKESSSTSTPEGIYGKNNSGAGKKIIIEYSSPNIAKSFHVGHLRSTIIGAFLVNLYKACGWDVVSMNYLGDWGTQFGLIASGYEKYGNQEALEADPIKRLFEIYVKVNKDAETDPTVRENAAAWFKRMEDGDEAAGGGTEDEAAGGMLPPSGVLSWASLSSWASSSSPTSDRRIIWFSSRSSVVSASFVLAVRWVEEDADGWSASVDETVGGVGGELAAKGEPLASLRDVFHVFHVCRLHFGLNKRTHIAEILDKLCEPLAVRSVREIAGGSNTELAAPPSSSETSAIGEQVP
ncbi:hypothetical protein NMY22_g15774 [Coprinellus aureogranulatus]|nr:hypothetical protein NMY22_g15774 [Coprinellus aureogranulatus]